MSEKTYLVVGAGKSGVCACELLWKTNQNYILYDGKETLDIDALRQAYEWLRDTEIVVGDFLDSLYERTDICVLSPGVPVELPFVEALRNRGVEIWGEVELAYRMGQGRIAAITGTNGKTTTTSLVGKILGLAFPDVKVVGNIGIPYTSVAKETSEDTVIVAEISSFQLETAIQFHPFVSAILNITPDHLDRHHTMENYIRIKESITKNQTSAEVCVLNFDDPALRAFGETLDCRVVYFSSKETPEGGVYVRDKAIWHAGEKVIDTGELQILGVHNYENASAAVAICLAFEVPMETIRKGLREFEAVEHRIQFVCEKEGVVFYNDSKGTNPDAAIKAVEAMERPTVLIGGGYDKNAAYDEWVACFGDKVKKLVLIGETADKIADCCKAHGFSAVERAEDLKDAVLRS
ncbi:MAG: UDP-N-acetylmuramoyl-L-alanine--D-glutamate ligase, partial [Lachnospiraceae bacterium]|nr:UDP-N-acetylmuramoyl-L-alanine--D-glutamate ligase [Lachnospiraceae bacterium]